MPDDKEFREVAALVILHALISSGKVGISADVAVDTAWDIAHKFIDGRPK